jgi:hypothetical protein
VAERVAELFSIFREFAPMDFFSLSGPSEVLDLKAKMVFNVKTLLGISYAIGSVAVNGGVEKQAFDVFDYVDPLIGTMDGGTSEYSFLACSFSLLNLTTILGHVFPGATLPYGILSLPRYRCNVPS